MKGFLAELEKVTREFEQQLLEDDIDRSFLSGMGQQLTALEAIVDVHEEDIRERLEHVRQARDHLNKIYALLGECEGPLYSPFSSPFDEIEWRMDEKLVFADASDEPTQDSDEAFAEVEEILLADSDQMALSIKLSREEGEHAFNALLSLYQAIGQRFTPNTAFMRFMEN
ncbi:hypothetical protein [Oceanobacter mangrovi]|uniref:hypothetical protein n=1 Tax=Oceanobacter mangrovi TaxID=2862510 RepID=UPI001C8DA506|nr:hypothetical protein [Oceanobacter mangrovi]